MAIGPHTTNKLTNDEKRIADQLEREIDAYIKQHYSGDGWLDYKLSAPVPPPVQTELVERYKQAGWLETRYLSEQEDPVSGPMMLLRIPLQ
jgi:hypothetical protein